MRKERRCWIDRALSRLKPLPRKETNQIYPTDLNPGVQCSRMLRRIRQTRQAPDDLWSIVRLVCGMIRVTCESPYHLIAAGAVTRPMWRKLNLLVRAGEQLLLRLLLIEAAAMSFNSPPRKPSGKPPKEIIYLDTPERLQGPWLRLPQPQRPGAHNLPPKRRGRARDLPSPERNIGALARRIEGLFHGVKWPHRYARMLAHRLARNPDAMHALAAPPMVARPVYEARDAALFCAPVREAIATITLPKIVPPRPRPPPARPRFQKRDGAALVARVLAMYPLKRDDDSS